MQIDFDNFRKKGVEAFNKLCTELNRRIHDDSTIGNSFPDNEPLRVTDIYNQMNALRDCIVTLICLEDKRDGIECLEVTVDEFAPEE